MSLSEDEKKFLQHVSVPATAHQLKITALVLYFIDYAITVVLIFPLCPPPPSTPPQPHAIPTPLFMSMGHAYKFFGYSISSTVLYIPMAIL